ncbi:MAG: peptide chain release factor N(5)-glutamine methyltransferase [Emcibacteraceae bacterium]|nr:peptide chain release factor N(5)-glutamine methyltransferase [Emcibacteraceae bacterium]MDG1995920.1 peptide chain release factor N(5)-glutamine methyltransferase [Emcibacteraceae bacterium]
MISLVQLRQDIKKRLEKSGIEEADLDARLLISEVTDVSDIDFAIDPDRSISDDEATEIMTLVKKRQQRIPMSQIFGEKEFWSLNFKVSSDTLTPRPDSETLIEATLKTVSDKTAPLKILDLGTGTGCLLLTLLTELPNSVGVGTDISEKALSIASENSNLLNLSDRVSFIINNWFKGIGDAQKFDIIISNPPYIGLVEKPELAPEVLDHEPHMALFAGEEGLDDYRLIANNVKPFMKSNAILVLEIGHLQAKPVSRIFNNAGFQSISIHKDLGGRDRCLVIV